MLFVQHAFFWQANFKAALVKWLLIQFNTFLCCPLRCLWDKIDCLTILFRISGATKLF